MKTRQIILMLLCLTLLLGVAGCGSSKLSESFVEEDVRQAAENVIDILNQANAKGIQELGTPQLQAALTDDVMTKVFTDLSSLGKFEKIEEMSVAGVKSQDGKENLAVVVAKAKYENKSVIYTISFNEAMELAGLFYK